MKSCKEKRIVEAAANLDGSIDKGATERHLQLQLDTQTTLRSLREHCRKLELLASSLRRELNSKEETEIDSGLPGQTGGALQLPPMSTNEVEDAQRLEIFHSHSLLARRKGWQRGDLPEQRDEALRNATDATSGSDAITIVSVAPEDASTTLPSGKDFGSSNCGGRGSGEEGEGGDKMVGDGDGDGEGEGEGEGRGGGGKGRARLRRGQWRARQREE